MIAAKHTGHAENPGKNRPEAPTYTSQLLFKGGALVWIEHMNERYNLRITKQGKLILTK